MFENAVNRQGSGSSGVSGSNYGNVRGEIRPSTGKHFLAKNSLIGILFSPLFHATGWFEIRCSDLFKIYNLLERILIKHIQSYTTDCPTSDCPLLQILGNTHRLSVLENFWGITVFLGIFFVKIENFATSQ